MFYGVVNVRNNTSATKTPGWNLEIKQKNMISKTKDGNDCDGTGAEKHLQ